MSPRLTKAKRQALERMVKLFERRKTDKSPEIVKAFMDNMALFYKPSKYQVESQLWTLQNWLKSYGARYERVHRFKARLLLGELTIEIKLNFHDYEFFVLIDGKIEKMFKAVKEIEPWLAERLGIPERK
ncbi:hypothetical protein [Paenibacillus albus]|uniref:Uncharacterized protein n=1 Tax=Paenibacillus albus TaxID=2495582 RepID=A0A3Q8X4N2_9BACL|nr:hypothetical protein [Paenibacillus albus]AZN40395.1 hypothetical protein EJC50_12600 [Paenibacillus albus]